MAEPEQLTTADNRRNIPVFTVLKNNAILKNIFLIHHNHSDMSSFNNGDGDGVTDTLLEENETEQILTFGRHPNCSIVVTHPSISRFHLQIRSKPNSGKLSVTDLSSVHGTWVSGKRIRPRASVELNEGDELRLGGSSRVYKLHWVSAIQAYDLDNPFCPSSDVVVSDDDLQKHDEESLVQDEAVVLSSGDESLKLEANTSFVSCEKVPLVRNETVLRGILKYKKESSPCMVKPLSFPLLDGEMMKVVEVGEVEVEKQLKNAPVFSEIECSQREWDDLSPVNGNLSEDTEVIKELFPLPESCTEDSKAKAEDCSPLLQVCINAAVLDIQESHNALSEEQSLVTEDDTEIHVDSAKGLSRSLDDESSCFETEKGTNQSVITNQTPMLDLTVGEFPTTENEEKLDALLIDTCDFSDVGNEASMLNITVGELVTSSTVMDNCGSTDAENDAPESTPVDLKLTIYPESSDENQHSKLERVSTERVSCLESIQHEDLIQLAEAESKSIQLMINSAMRLTPREETVAIESGNGTLVSDSGIQILEPLLDSFLFTEKDSNESCGFLSMKSELENQSPKTPLGYQTESYRSPNTSKVSSQRSQSLAPLQTLSCSSKVKRKGSTTVSARSQLKNSNAVEVEMYTPDKENFTPNTRLLKSIKRNVLLNESKMKVSNSSSRAEQNYFSGSEKENDSQFFRRELALRDGRDQNGNKKTSICVQGRSERVPLQSLSVNSSCRSKHDSSSVNKAATRSLGSVTRSQFHRKISPIRNKIELEAKAKWCMVVDTACLLESESRKALTLLQGLRGTKLIVPGTVLRELDVMKHQAGFFRRATEVSAALKWLEDCLVSTKWWIQILSSVEEGRHLPSTPPASPKLFDGGWKTFSFFRKPKTEDHILECALQQMRSIDDDQRIAVLSKDTSLRIKAISQGFICETATEFRDSLVNPFSERFLWPESSPRGRTWSCHDDFVLRQLFYCHHPANTSQVRDTVKGLKLILEYDSRDNKTASNLQWK